MRVLHSVIPRHCGPLVIASGPLVRAGAAIQGVTPFLDCFGLRPRNDNPNPCPKSDLLDSL
ncbi:MAG: hypothetical protein LBT00_02970 [Spirochaetaceae bacterium]|nr:hypothetical protein [Spirochaetaceae bacterium]